MESTSGQFRTPSSRPHFTNSAYLLYFTNIVHVVLCITYLVFYGEVICNFVTFLVYILNSIIR